ncbi:LITAF-like zinc ribbon domain-containing protein [Vibrio cholerae]|uniref:LITAF-like zinc ribbon domain-containing protein n=2 Tax=Vibrio cholerae TaxID=666 RepID=UPI002081ACC9|nr:hypothetical protein VCSRO121_3450 [Vibrio cholerae]
MEIKRMFCPSCNKTTGHTNETTKPSTYKHLFLSLVIPFWFVVWIILYVKHRASLHTCVVCGNQQK